MKKTNLFMLLFLLCISCSKNSSATLEIDNEDIVGMWEEEGTDEDGFTQVFVHNFRDNGNIISKGTISIIDNSNVTIDIKSKGKWRIEEDTIFIQYSEAVLNGERIAVPDGAKKFVVEHIDDKKIITVEVDGEKHEWIKGE